MPVVGRRGVLAVVAGALCAAIGVAARPAPVQPVQVVAEEAAAPELPLAPDQTTVSVPIRRGSTLGTLLEPYGVPAAVVRRAALSVYDLATIRPDRELSLTWTDGDALPIALRYVLDDDRVLVVDRFGDEWTARLDEVVYDTEVQTRDLMLTRSLWEDGLDAGLRPEDLVTLAKIFEYDVDFNTELRSGAEFTLVADVGVAPGRRPRLQTVHAVKLVNGTKEYVAVRHVESTGEVGWYNPDGSGMKKPFLRSPIEFSRVTSGFNPGRFHPILKIKRPHNGTDFGAPQGTPIRAVADGTVEFAGDGGGHGNYVKLDHGDATVGSRRGVDVETSYSHLSKIRVKKGQHVRQGDVIGDVGMTGLATGPHLHFQMWLDGKYVDAMSVDLPASGVMSAAERAAFEEDVARWVPELTPAVADGETQD